MTTDNKMNMVEAVVRGHKKMLGTVGVSFAPVGLVGLTVGSGDTLGKMFQVILLGQKLNGEREQVVREVADLLRESELFLHTDLPDTFASERGKRFHEAIDSLITEWLIIMGCAQVDIEAEAQMNAEIREMTLAQARAQSGMPQRGIGQANQQNRVIRPS